jgi:hypothetical protein
MSAVLDTQNRPSAVRFGSDDNFCDGGYQVPGISKSQRDRSGALLNIPFAAAAIKTEPPTSATPSRPAFPAKRQDQNEILDLPTPNSAHLNSSSWNLPGHAKAEAHNDSSDDQKQQPRKRRKGTSSTGETATKSKNHDGSPAKERNEGGASSSSGNKRRKPAQERASSPQSPESSEDEVEDAPSSARKRKEKKQPRQNLSDKQKRENHIMSEKKRRHLIKTGYADLNKLVPALAGGKSALSRSESLFECQTYLESLLVGTQEIMKVLGVGQQELCDRVGVELGAIALKSDEHPD